jgi:hypothetical protein
MISPARKKWFEEHKEEKQAYDRAYRAKNKEKIALKKAEYAKTNPEKIKISKAKYRKNNAEVLKAKGKEYIRKNSEKITIYIKTYRQKNVGKVRYWAMKRHTAKLQRTPAWLTGIDLERIQNEYKLAALLTKLTGEPWHVDHIVPLQGKNVSGLHTPSNLRAIRGAENISKRNHWADK